MMTIEYTHTVKLSQFSVPSSEISLYEIVFVHGFHSEHYLFSNSLSFSSLDS